MDKILKMNTRMQTSIMILFGALVFAMKLTNVNVEEFSKENQLIAILIIVFVVTHIVARKPPKLACAEELPLNIKYFFD